MSSSRDSSNTLMTEHFFSTAYPEPKEKNFHTQLGVHFEEVAEMLSALDGKDLKSSMLLKMVHDANLAISLALKQGEIGVVIKDRVELLDGLCDQIVTAVGVGYMAGMQVSEAFGEVNESNDSKFGLNGEVLLDENLKMMKGPNYFKPNLKDYV